MCYGYLQRLANCCCYCNSILLLLLLVFITYKHCVQSKNYKVINNEKIALYKEKEKIQTELQQQGQQCQKLTSDIEEKDEKLRQLQEKISLISNNNVC